MDEVSQKQLKKYSNLKNKILSLASEHSLITFILSKNLSILPEDFKKEYKCKDYDYDVFEYEAFKGTYELGSKEDYEKSLEQSKKWLESKENKKNKNYKYELYFKQLLELFLKYGYNEKKDVDVYGILSLMNILGDVENYNYVYMSMINRYVEFNTKKEKSEINLKDKNVKYFYNYFKENLDDIFNYLIEERILNSIQSNKTKSSIEELFDECVEVLDMDISNNEEEIVDINMVLRTRQNEIEIELKKLENEFCKYLEDEQLVLKSVDNDKEKTKKKK